MGGIAVDSVPPRTPLPRFLKPWQSPQGFGTHASVPVHAVYEHKRPFGKAQVLWWPPVTRARNIAPVVPRTVLLFIPGNPGLLDHYVPFLNAIHRETVSESSDPDPDSYSNSNSNSNSNASPSSSVTIFAHAHLGLSSYIDIDGPSFSFPETSSVALPAQIEAHLEFLDELLAAYYYAGHPATRVLLVGHSIGAWFVQELLKARAAQLRPGPRALGAYLLFPTISRIGQSPCGRTLSPLFRPPWPRTLAHLSLLVRHLPPCILRLFFRPSWPANQLQVLRGLLRAPAAIYAALTMAHDEMETVRELDVGFLRDFAENVWFYYAEEDGWVGEQRGVVLRAVRGTPAESRVVHGRRGGVPHAFCINHSAEVASQCVEWMRTGGFLGDVKT